MKRPPTLGRAVDRGLAPFRGRRTAHLLPRTRLGGPVPWVIAIMTALTVLAVGGALALSNLAASARGELAGSATVQILEADPDLRAEQTQRVAALLRQDASVEAVRVVPESEIAALLEPWLGTGEAIEAVPLPALIDLQLASGSGEAQLEALEGRIAAAAPSARIDAQEAWLAPVLEALNSLRYMAFALIALLAFTGAAAVWLAARNALDGNRETIEIVHLLGGSDEQVARVFQRSILFDALAGGVLGLALGTGAILLVAGRFAALDSGMVAGGTLLPTDWTIVALVPLFAVGIAVYTARMTVLSFLRKML
ncbi:cell division protein [Qipengyuania gaetbuli]|uniref:cell division protein FtsX n=1 Tax=Qipengyuania gaetbuli TaxID=266952 RepID=UPI001C99C4E5|nr:cell division protein [Qipengyuania gaetbuli]MBY6015948.1 cell division protein [Qipengyuania gaetbuli]